MLMLSPGCAWFAAWSQAEPDGELLQTNWILGLQSFPFWKLISLSKKPQPRNGAKICFMGDK